MKRSQSQINLNASEKSSTFQEKWRRNLKKTLRFNMWLLLIFAVLHIGANLYASVLLNGELNLVREKNEPLTLSAMKPNLSEAQNAAPLYQQALQAENFQGKEKNELEGGKLEADFATRRPQILARNQKMFDLLRQAAARPACSFDETWTQNFYSTGPKYYAQMRSLARLMRAQATQEAREGDSAAALRDVRVMFQMADHLKSEPVSDRFFGGARCRCHGQWHFGRSAGNSTFARSAIAVVCSYFARDRLGSRFSAFDAGRTRHCVGHV